jgi:acetyltransferase-like isoleucine patch superfamily enzyme
VFRGLRRLCGDPRDAFLKRGRVISLNGLRSHVKKIPGTRAIYKLVLRILQPKPRGLRHFGDDSILWRPRHVDGNNFISIGARTSIRHHAWLSATTKYADDVFQPELTIGSDVYIGNFCCIFAIHEVTIEDGCVLSDYVYITDSAHGIDPEKGPIMEQNLSSKGGVRIGRSSFIGYRACIMSGVTLGEHCVVGANAVVTKSFPAYSMVAGVPAQLVKRYSFAEKKWVDCKSKTSDSES